MILMVLLFGVSDHNDDRVVRVLNLQITQNVQYKELNDLNPLKMQFGFILEAGS